MVRNRPLAPNFWWNARHDFISLRHTAEIAQLDRELFHPERLAEFVAAQFAVFGPAFMGMFWWKSVSPDGCRGDADRLMLFPALAMLGIISLQALVSRAHPNWAAPAFVSATVFVSALMVREGRRRLFAWAMGINLALLSILYHYHPLADVHGIELKRGLTPYYRILGWRELGAEISDTTNRYPGAVLLSDSRKHLAYLSYYSVPRNMRVAWCWPAGGIPRNQYHLIADISKLDADEFIYVGPSELGAAELGSFDHHEYLDERKVQVLPDLAVSVRLYHLQGFNGFVR